MRPVLLLRHSQRHNRNNVRILRPKSPGMKSPAPTSWSTSSSRSASSTARPIPDPASVASRNRFINYGKNKSPEWLTCCHEESSVAMAHGYAKIEGKPMMIMAHGTVGLQHASMAIYNAYADRVPVYIVLGNIFDVNYRRGNAEWVHSVQDAAAMVRDYTKWDDTPVSLSHFAESAVRAYKISMTPPYEPVVLVADGTLAGRAHRGKESAHPQTRDERAAARRFRCRRGSGPHAGRRRKSRDRGGPRGAHTEGHRAPRGTGGSAAGPRAGSAHAHELPFRASFVWKSRAAAADLPTSPTADVILGLEVQDFWGITHKMTALNRFGMETRSSRSRAQRSSPISAIELNHKSNYQDFGRYVEADLAITGDPEATLPALDRSREETDHSRPPPRAPGARHEDRRAEPPNGDKPHRETAGIGWDASPISTARLVRRTLGADQE